MIIEMRWEMRIHLNWKPWEVIKIINNFIPFCFSIFFLYFLIFRALSKATIVPHSETLNNKNNNNNIFKSFIIMFLVVSTIIIIFKIICWKILVFSEPNDKKIYIKYYGPFFFVDVSRILLLLNIGSISTSDNTTNLSLFFR